MHVGSSNPGVGSLLNRWVRPRFLSDESARAWLKHNVEEVGNFEHFLPETFAQRAPSTRAKAV